MKILIILATALLVPIVMKFQTETILEKSNPVTAQQVKEVLVEKKVAGPEATMHFLEATIGGSVANEAEAEAIVSAVGQVRGVSSVNNQLIVQGWLTVERTGKTLLVSGHVPSSWKTELLKGQPGANTKELAWRDSIQLAGKSAVAWGLYLDDFLQPEGDRRLKLTGNQLELSGEITPSELATLRAKSANLGTGISFENQMTPRASRFHFESRELRSAIEGEPLRALAQKLADSTLEFQAQSSQLSSQGKTVAHRLLELILQSPAGTTFVLGGYPDNFGESLAQQRAEVVKAFLVENGVPAQRLEVVPYEMTEDGRELSGQVELLVR